jgi:hypothetical protein
MLIYPSIRLLSYQLSSLQSLDITDVDYCPDGGVNLICLAQLLLKEGDSHSYLAIQRRHYEQSEPSPHQVRPTTEVLAPRL